MHCWRNARDGRGGRLNPRLLAAFGGPGPVLGEPRLREPSLFAVLRVLRVKSFAQLLTFYAPSAPLR